MNLVTKCDNILERLTKVAFIPVADYMQKMQQAQGMNPNDQMSAAAGQPATTPSDPSQMDPSQMGMDPSQAQMQPDMQAQQTQAQGQQTAKMEKDQLWAALIQKLEENHELKLQLQAATGKVQSEQDAAQQPRANQPMSMQGAADTPEDYMLQGSMTAPNRGIGQY